MGGLGSAWRNHCDHAGGENCRTSHATRGRCNRIDSTAAPAGWPDFAARRQAIFGQQILPAGTAQALVDEDRGA